MPAGRSLVQSLPPLHPGARHRRARPPFPSARAARTASGLALTLALALTFSPPARAAVQGPRSQEIRDGQGGLLTQGFAFANDGLGRTLAAGDFNGDGLDDLAVAEMESLVGQGEGAVRILYGSVEGLLGAGALPSQLIYDFLPASGALDREAFDDFGAALAAGDFDCDGKDDLAIGIPGEDVGGQADAGAVLVLSGSAIGLITSNLTGLEPQRFYQGLSSVGGTAEAGDRFGQALAVGNFDYGSGRDLAIGIPGEDDSRGSVLLLYSAIGCNRLGLTVPNYWGQDASGVLDTSEPGDQFGYRLAAGDFASDHADDLAVGIVGEDVAGQADAGAVQVLYGVPSLGLRSDGNQFWHESLIAAGGFTEAGDRFGEALATGDLNGDGVDDLAVGAPAEDVAFHPDAGAVTVLKGVAGSGLTGVASETLDQSTVVDGESLGDFDNFGYSLAIGDFIEGNAPGADLAIGIPQESVGFPVVYELEGAITLVPGGGSFLQTGQATLWSKGFFGSAGTLVLSPEYYGYALATGDFDGNGHADLAIGAVRVEGIDPFNNSVTSGAVYTLGGTLFSDGFERLGLDLWSATRGCASCLAEGEPEE